MKVDGMRKKAARLEHFDAAGKSRSVETRILTLSLEPYKIPPAKLVDDLYTGRAYLEPDCNYPVMLNDVNLPSLS